MNNDQFDADKFIERDTKLEQRLKYKDSKDTEKVIQFLDELCELAKSTDDPEYYALALKLLYKWKINLSVFYNKSYRKSVLRSPSDFLKGLDYGLDDEETMQIYKTTQELEKEGFVGWKKKSDDITTQGQSKEKDDEAYSFKIFGFKQP